jgi:hypothetical protein
MNKVFATILEFGAAITMLLLALWACVAAP